jgi:hypothetical protein
MWQKYNAFQLLPFAGITQIRFEGISHPALHLENCQKTAQVACCQDP